MTTAATYMSRYGYSGPLPDLVTEADLAAVEARLANSEFTVPDPARIPRFSLFSPPGQPPRELPGRERMVRFDQLDRDQQITRISFDLSQISQGRRRTAEIAAEAERRQRADRACRWCPNMVAKPEHLGMIIWAGTEHAGLCIECVDVAHAVIAAQAQTVERVTTVLDRLGLDDQR